MSWKEVANDPIARCWTKLEILLSLHKTDFEQLHCKTRRTQKKKKYKLDKFSAYGSHLLLGRKWLVGSSNLHVTMFSEMESLVHGKVMKIFGLLWRKGYISRWALSE